MQKETTTVKTGMEIAVIGMAGRFPGSKNINEFWNNLKKGIETISFFSDSELEESGANKELLDKPDYVKAMGYLEDREYFDAPFFGYTPGEAKLMSPQTRFFHECVWEALEDAGYNPDTCDEKIGIYGGASPGFYWEALSHASGSINHFGTFASKTLINKDYLCSRVSYNLNLKGGCFVLQTTCSTSLVALHQGCRSLLTGESDIAVSGGISITAGPKRGYLYQEGMILSPDGHCRAFSAKAQGTVGGEGAAVVVLKRLKPAIEDRDHIYAMIRGSAINNDGKRKVGFTAPSIEGQAEVIRAAQRMARIEPESITYIEAHGTGTTLGDPVEIEALKLAFNTRKRNYCGIGSVKSNFGHLDTVAGIAGFIKTVLALQHKLIPPSLHFDEPNPKIDIENSPFYVNTSLKQWESNGFPLRAAVSSFGIGGTNAHVVLEEWIGAPASLERSGKPGAREEYQLFLLSAKTESALEKMTQNLARHLKNNPDLNLADVAYTLKVGRKAWQNRRMFICSGLDAAVDILSQPNPPEMKTLSVKDEKERRVIYMFSGQGSQYVNMGRNLYQTELLFREEMDRCFEILKPLLGYDIKEILYPRDWVSEVSGESSGDHRNTGTPGHQETIKSAVSPGKINQTAISQPLLFVFEYALAKLLMKWGITPHGMIGHSIGEYVAACLLGVFTLEDALKLVVYRGKLMQQLPGGAMLSVPLGEEQLNPLMKDNEDISLAAVNSPSHCVVSGPGQAIADLGAHLRVKGYETTALHTSHAFHSSMMDPILKTFETYVSQVTLNNPQIPFISDVTGKWITPQEAVDPSYWALHIRKTVRFSQGVKELLKEGPSLFLEVGPGKTLTTLVKQHESQDDNTGTLSVNLVRHPKESISDCDYLTGSLGRLWLYGKTIDWKKCYSREKRYRVALPTYPFEGRRYWIDGDPFKIAAEKLAGNSSAVKKPNAADWFYVPLWEQTIPCCPCPGENQESLNWLVFMDDRGLAAQLSTLLRQNRQQVIKVKSGTRFTREKEDVFIISPEQPGDYDALFSELRDRNRLPHRILHFWSVTGSSTIEIGVDALEKSQNRGFFSLLNIVQATGRLNIINEIRIDIVTDNMQRVSGETFLCPEKATLLGAVKIIPLEYPNIKCRSVDILIPEPGSREENKLPEHLLGEFTSDFKDRFAAYRGGQRWIRIYRPYPLAPSHQVKQRFKEKGVYLIVGGFGGMGFTLAGHLAETYKARLILVGRSDFPARQQWQDWLKNREDDNDNEITQQIMKIQEWESLGAEVMECSADVTNPLQMKKVILQANHRFSQLNGVIFTAGIVDYAGAIQKRTPQITGKYMAPKIKGVLVLEELLKSIKPDFVTYFSSVGNVIFARKFGQVSYNASNDFLEAFADWKNLTGDTFTTTINWNDWKEVGMSVKTLKKQFADKKQKVDLDKLLYDSLSRSEGIEVFRRIMGSSLHRVTVSTRDLMIRLHEQDMLLEKDIGENTFEQLEKSRISDEDVPLYQRPQLSTPYAAPRTQTEESLANIFQRLSGIEKIGIHDDFFELGGDSLKAMTVIANIHKEMKIKIPLVVFFNHTTIGELAKYIGKSQKTEYSSIKPVEEREYYALSSGQKRLYVLLRLQENSITYNQPSVNVFTNLDIKRLEEATRELLQRHESLRTSFELVDGEPVQRIHKETIFKIESHESSENDAHRIVENFVKPFDLEQLPLFRMGIIKIGEKRSLLLLDIHHIISDGVSNTIFNKEIMILYQGKELPPLNLQYKDYSQWQKGQVQQETIKKQQTYWLKQFEGDIPNLELPTDYPIPLLKTFQGDHVSFMLGDEVSKKLKQLAKEIETTLYMVLLSIYAILLCKYTRQEDLVVGSPITGRRHVDLQNVIGMFVNMLALRIRPGGNKTFREFLVQVKETTLNAYENQDYPFDELVTKLGLQGRIGRNPLFNVVFILNTADRVYKNPGEKEPGQSKVQEYKPYSKLEFDLIFAATEYRDNVHMSLNYAVDLFKKSTAENLKRRFLEILKQVIENVDIKLNDLVLSHQLLVSKSDIFKEDQDDFGFK